MPRPIVIAWLCVPVAGFAGMLGGILIDTHYLRPDPQPVVLRVTEPKPLMWLDCSNVKREIHRVCASRKRAI